MRQLPNPRHTCPEEGALSEWLYAVPSPHSQEVAVVARLLLAVFLTGLGAHNNRVTGSALRMPYQAYEESVCDRPDLLVSARQRSDTGISPPEIERYWLEWGREWQERMRSLDHMPEVVTTELLRHVIFFLGPGVLGLVGYLHRRPRASDHRFA